MRFSPEFIEEIKARVRVSDVVGRRVRLKRQGREWRGLSPFNAEKTPSFYVNDAKMAWFDFSAGRNGNVFDFLIATEGLTFPEAVERLAAEAGLPLPTATPESAARDRKRASLAEITEMAAVFFERCLKGPEGARGRDYLLRRGIAATTQATFRLGFAPAARYALRDHLAGKGVALEAMMEAGLVKTAEGVAVPYDHFRDRVIFPIEDRAGRVIAFGGRALDPGVPAKYLNSPETPLFHKGAMLYNHHRARKAAQEGAPLLAVEGYVDVIALSAAGFPAVVAGLGTALTAEQCELLWRMSPEPILCFDGDGAGRRAAFKALDTALPMLRPDRTLRFAFLPEGQDPDDLVRAGGAGAMQPVIEAARPLVDVLWSRETEHASLDTPERRAGLERRLFELAATIADEGLRRHYGAELRARLNGLRATPQSERPARAAAPFRPGGRPRSGPPPLRGYRSAPPPRLGTAFGAPAPVPAPAAYGRRDAEILMLILNHPALLDQHAEELARLDFGHPELQRLRDVVLALMVDHPLEHDALKAAIDAAGLGEIRRRVEAVAARAPLWSSRPEAALEDAELSLHQALVLHRKAKDLNNHLREAALALEQEPTEGRFAALRDIQAQLTMLEGTEASIEGYGGPSGHPVAETK